MANTKKIWCSILSVLLSAVKALYFIVLYVLRLEPLVNATFRIFIVSSSENTISSYRANKFKAVHTFVFLNQSEISSLHFEVKTKVSNEMSPLKLIEKKVERNFCIVSRDFPLRVWTVKVLETGVRVLCNN